MQVRPYLIRAYIHHLAERHSDAAKDLITAWQIDADEVIDDVEHRPFIDFLCLKEQSPEATLLLTELYFGQAAASAAIGSKEDAKLKALQAMDMLFTLKPLNTGDQTQIPGSISGQLTYDALTRSANRLVKGGDVALAKEGIQKMQAWALTIFSEEFDSLTDVMRELS